MKQTAVEWLIEQMLKQGFFDGNKPLSYTTLDHIQQQAKEMEKQQVINAFGVGCQVESNRLIGYQDLAEQYYNETFGGNK